MRWREFTLGDFVAQMGQVEKLGPMKRVMGMIPGMGVMQTYETHAGDIERQMREFGAMYRSMTLRVVGIGARRLERLGFFLSRQSRGVRARRL